MKIRTNEIYKGGVRFEAVGRRRAPVVEPVAEAYSDDGRHIATILRGDYPASHGNFYITGFSDGRRFSYLKKIECDTPYISECPIVFASLAQAKGAITSAAARGVGLQCCATIPCRCDDARREQLAGVRYIKNESDNLLIVLDNKITGCIRKTAKNAIISADENAPAEIKKLDCQEYWASSAAELAIVESVATAKFYRPDHAGELLPATA